MITFDNALKKARMLKPNVDNCTEYERGYVFGSSEDDGYVGGGHTPVVILKQTGDAVNMAYFVSYGSGEEIREFAIL